VRGRDQRPGDVPALSAPRLQAELLLTNYWFECPCHGSRYDRIGTKVLEFGPAPRGLDRFAVSVDGGGVLTVDTSKLTLGPLPVALGQPGILPRARRAAAYEPEAGSRTGPRRRVRRMTDERTGRELTPRDPEGDQIVVRERVQPQSPERFYAGDNAHVVGLTEERAAQIVRQSGNARSVAFLFTLIMVLFIPLYWFYDLGIPAIAGTSRLDAEKDAQHITDVSRGYELYINNCATCHGAEGKGGVGPPLNDQAKLYNAVKPDGGAGTGHLNPNYLQRVLEVGGRYVCGDPNSIMPAWLQPRGR
jgi:mono/diheme cytochrome c family protein